MLATYVLTSGLTSVSWWTRFAAAMWKMKCANMHKHILICSLCSHWTGGGLCHSASEAKACYRHAPSRNICACSWVMSTLRERRALYTSSAFKNPSLSMSNSVKIWSRGSIPEAMFFRLSQICKGALKSGRGCTLLSNDQTSACL